MLTGGIRTLNFIYGRAIGNQLLKQRNNVLPQAKEETSAMSDQRRRGIAWVEHGLNPVNIAMQDPTLGLLGIPEPFILKKRPF